MRTSSSERERTPKAIRAAELLEARGAAAQDLEALAAARQRGAAAILEQAPGDEAEWMERDRERHHASADAFHASAIRRGRA